MKRSHLFLFAGVFAALIPVTRSAQTTASTIPEGLMVADLPVGNSALAFPLIAGEVFVGTIASNTSSALTFAKGAIGTRLTASEKYYVEVQTGPFAGDRFDLDTAATITGPAAILDLSAGSASTLSALATDVLAGARGAVRPRITLAKIAAMLSPALVGNNSSALADCIQVFSNGVFVTYYLRADGQTWREPGKLVDERNRVIPPDRGVIVQLRSGAKRWTHQGRIRNNAFHVVLSAGSQAFATGYPLDMSPAEIVARVDTNQPAGRRWVGSNTLTAADTLKIYDASTGTFQTYYLRADGVSWCSSAAASDFSTTALLPAVGMILLTRANPDSDYLILPSFSL